MVLQIGTVAGHPRPGVLEAIRRAIDAARMADCLPIFVKAEFRPGYPDVSPNSRVFSGLAKIGRLIPTDPGCAFEPSVAPDPGDIVVTKKRTSSFSGSDLEVVLRSQRIENLILTGIRTSGVVLSTLIEAAALDYRLTVLSDCCADVDPDLEKMLMERLFPRYATVCEVGEWVASL
jgi:nicotinamidase-related amidase